MYKEESCKEIIIPGTSVTFEDFICIGVFVNDNTTLFSYLHLAALLITQRDAFIPRTIDMLNIATIRRSLDRTNTKGQVYALIPIIFIGRLEISMIIVLTQTERALSNGLECEECLRLKEIYVVVMVIP